MNKKEIRRAFRKAVFKRDDYTCQGCGFVSSPETAIDELDAHHIIDRSELNENAYDPNIGITLCKAKCHLKAEKFHKTNGKEWEEGFHPFDLFAIIGGSGSDLLREE